MQGWVCFACQCEPCEDEKTDPNFDPEWLAMRREGGGDAVDESKD
jgi:hypothetical protein